MLPRLCWCATEPVGADRSGRVMLTANLCAAPMLGSEGRLMTSSDRLRCSNTPLRSIHSVYSIGHSRPSMES